MSVGTNNTSAPRGNNISRDRPVRHRQARARDPFQFYSNPRNLRRALTLQPPDSSSEEDHGQTQVKRKKRISFEMDPLALLMADANFRAQLESSDVTGAH